MVLIGVFEEHQTHHEDMEGMLRTLFVMLPLIDAIRIMLPGRPNLTICLPAACAVKRTPFVLTSNT